MYPNDLLTGVEEPADIIVANILADIILRMVEDAYRLVKDNGYFVVSGIIESKKEEIVSAIEGVGFTLDQTFQQKDWYAFIFQKVVE